MDEIWRYLSIERQQLVRRVDFLVAYGGTCMDELRRSDFADTADRSWEIVADAAASLAEAAQLALCFDPNRAVPLLDRAGSLFLALGQPYGMYLRTLAGQWPDPQRVSELDIGASALETAHGVAGSREDVGHPWFVPQQQAYYLLAAAGSEPFRRTTGRELFDVASGSPNRHGVAATGATGIPVYRLWDVAMHLLRSDDEPSRAVDVTVAHLSAMAARHSEQVRLAMQNQFLWRHAASPVVVGDVDIAGIVTLALRAVGPGELMQKLAPLIEHFDAVGAAVLEAGLALHEETQSRNQELEVIEDTRAADDIPFRRTVEDTTDDDEESGPPLYL